MKATRTSTWKFELDNEAVKAIRFVMGYNTNLRVSLGSSTSLKESTQTRSRIWDFIDANLAGITSIDFMLSRPNAQDPDWDKYERCLNDMAQQVMR